MSEITLGQLLETMTTGTKVKIIKDSDIIYIGTALNAFDTSSPEVLAEEVVSVKATQLDSQLIRI